MDDQVVGGEDDEEVEEVIEGGALGADEARSEGVEEDLEGATPRPRTIISLKVSMTVKMVSTNAKNVFPATLFNTTASNLLGKSVSIPSSPKYL